MLCKYSPAFSTSQLARPGHNPLERLIYNPKLGIYAFSIPPKVLILRVWIVTREIAKGMVLGIGVTMASVRRMVII